MGGSGSSVSKPLHDDEEGLADKFAFGQQHIPVSARVQDYACCSYKQQLIATPKPPALTVDTVAKSLQAGQPPALQTFLEATGRVDVKGVKVWAADEHYRDMNRAILNDDEDQLKIWIPLFRALNYHLVDVARPEQAYTAWRGAKFDDDVYEAVQIGAVIRVCMYCAVSLDRAIAERFKYKYVVKFNVPKGCFNAAPIWDHSSFPNEREILLQPYTPVKVIAKSHSVIEVDVLDGKLASMEQKKAFAAGVQQPLECYMDKVFEARTLQLEKALKTGEASEMEEIKRMLKKHKVKYLLEAGYSLKALRSTGVTARDCYEAGVPLGQVRSVYTFYELKRAGFHSATSCSIQ